jgi:predicted dehydrogenase
MADVMVVPRQELIVAEWRPFNIPREIRRWHFRRGGLTYRGVVWVVDAGKFIKEPFVADKKLRVGIVGMGAIGCVHADAYNNGGQAEVVALCDIDAQRLQERGQRFKVSNLFTDYHDLVRADLDAVSVCVPNAFHKDVAIAALKAGKNILLEKPMALNATQAAQIVAVGLKSKKVVQIGMCNRQGADAQVLKGYIDQGMLGNIYHVRAVLIRRRGVPGLGGWFTTKKLSGGGPIIDIGVHWFDLAMYLSGQWNPTRVAAQTYAKFGCKMRDYKYVGMWAGPPKFEGVCDVEDYATGFVRFAGKATMSFDIAWAANGKEDSFVEVLGDKGGARVMESGGVDILTEDGQRPVNFRPQYDDKVDRFKVQAGKFIAACRGQCKPAATMQQGLTVMKLIDAIYASGKSGKEVVIK